MNPHVTIMILTWNGCQLTLDCLRSIKEINYKNLSVMVIDNASVDNTISSIHSQFPTVQVLALDKNYGYSGGYNLAFKHLSSSKTEYVMLLNNDTIVDSECLSVFLLQMSKNEKQILGPKIYYMDFPQKIWYAGGKIDLMFGNLSHRGIRQKDTHQFNVIMETDYVSGCCLFTHFSTINKLHGFDEDFNMYAEDVDLCLRAQSIGINCNYIPDANVWHKVSASIGGEKSFRKLKQKSNSVLKLINKHYPNYVKYIGYPLYLIRQVINGIKILFI